MAKGFAKAFYKSAAWSKCRASYIKERIAIDGGYCEKCKEELGYIVHHTILLTPQNISDPSVTLNHEYLRYECKKCHDKNEGHFNKNKKTSSTKDGYRFNEEGQLVPVLPP